MTVRQWRHEVYLKTGPPPLHVISDEIYNLGFKGVRDKSRYSRLVWGMFVVCIFFQLILFDIYIHSLLKKYYFKG